MFKNLMLYRLSPDFQPSREAFEEQLARGTFVPCAATQPASKGWVGPRDPDELVYACNNQWLIALKTAKKLLPAAVVRQEVAAQAAVIAEQQGYEPGRKQLRELKEKVTEELLAKAYVVESVTQAWVDLKNHWLVVDASSAGKADALIEMLRLSLDEFPLLPVNTNLSASSAMADWLASGDAPAGFTVDRECELRAISEEKAAVRYVRHPLDGETISEEIKAHLATGKLPVKLALTWNDRLSFVLTEKGEIKRLAFLDLVMEEHEASLAEAADVFDANFALMTGELVRFLPDYLAALGGEADI